MRAFRVCHPCMTFSCEKQGQVVAVLEGPLGHETRQGRSREVRCTALAIINKPAALLCDLLQSEPNTPILEQGCANEATSSRPREHRSEARPRRPASSLRSHLIYNRDRWLAKSCTAASCAAAKFAENYWGRTLWIDRLRLPRCGGWWGGFRRLRLMMSELSAKHLHLSHALMRLYCPVWVCR